MASSLANGEAVGGGGCCKRRRPLLESGRRPAARRLARPAARLGRRCHMRAHRDAARGRGTSSADTNILQSLRGETLDTLRRHQSFCISSCLSVVRKHGWEDEDDSWKAHFDRVSAQERRKFDEETLWNWNGVKQKKTYSMKTDGSKNEYVVVTILVAAEGTMELPEAIRSAADLDAVAARLNSTPESELRGVRVLWTPQDADDVLSEERMRKDYPNLKPLA